MGFTTSDGRRRLLTAAAAAPAAGLFAGCKDKTASQPLSAREPVLFFTASEHQFVEAACGRLIPEGKENNGALTAAVPFFIDRQLAGPYGQAHTRYSEPPWREGMEEQGYQLAYSPAALYRKAIGAINTYCEREFGRPFANLGDDQQDDLLHQLEDGKIDLGDVPSNVFFDHLWQNTLEGYLADPMYGGNRDFTGWKLIGFPGPRYNYVQEITQYGRPYPHPPVGLLGRDGHRIKG